MRKQFNFVLTFALLSLCISCSDKTKEAQLAIDKYCELNMKEHNASQGAERDAATAEKKAFVKEVDDKYFNDTKTYQYILAGMQKCDEKFPENDQSNMSSDMNSTTEIPSAYGDAVTVAKNYCNLIDRLIALSQNGTDAELKETIATRVIFEKNLDESFKDNPQRRDSILELIKPCLQKEMEFKTQK